MKKKYLIVLAILGTACTGTAFGQAKSANVSRLVDSALQKAVNDTSLLNSAAAQIFNALGNGKLKDALKDIKFSFKTFQAADQTAALGFTYDYSHNWSWIGKNYNFAQTLNIEVKGDVAFRSADNPTDFLENKIAYGGNFFFGGIAKRNTALDGQAVTAATKELAAANAAGDAEKRKEALAKMNALHHVSDQFFISINASPSYESNQAFTRQQFAPGAYVAAGGNGLDASTKIGWYNLPDYPFALLRLLTGTDTRWHLSPNLPVVLGGIDHVIPTDDSLRKAVTGALNPYNRVRLEASFKTEALRVSGKGIYFTADYRWYNELGASAAEKTAGIARSTYFVATLQSSNGFFISYSTGKLPLDVKTDQVYSIGFQYAFGNWAGK